MNNADFWASVRSIIADGFTPDGLQKLDRYAEQFISNALVYQRFSPQEHHGWQELKYLAIKLVKFEKFALAPQGSEAHLYYSLILSGHKWFHE